MCLGGVCVCGLHAVHRMAARRGLTLARPSHARPPQFTDLRGRCANLIKHLTTIAASSGTFVFYENNCFFLTIGSGKGNWAPLRPADKKKVVYDALTQGARGRLRARARPRGAAQALLPGTPWAAAVL